MNVERVFMSMLVVFLCLAFGLTISALAVADEDEQMMLVRTFNPEPDLLPTLGVWQKEYEARVSATFPDVPGLTFDAGCYESRRMVCVGVLALEGGGIELRHHDLDNPQVVYVTTITPEPGAVEFKARAELAPGASGPLPDNLQTLNLCWQLRRAPGFQRAPDGYWEFVGRCFIFTEEGRTFLDQTTRKPIPSRPLTDEANNPPLVQNYVGVWQDVPEASPTSWAAYSPDQYVTTVIGAVSRDGEYLAALANDSAPNMSQAWHDCMHNNASWMPEDSAPEDREWRVKVYVMENDPEALLERARVDFPSIRMPK